jgi:hypothetical protein
MSKLNEKIVKDVIKSRPVYPYTEASWLMEEYWEKLLDSLGDSEDDIIAFVSSADKDVKRWISEIVEELYDKFPTVNMDAFLKTVYPDMWGDG